MKKLNKKIIKSCEKIAGFAGESTSLWFLYQPKMPEALRNRNKEKCNDKNR
jgi:cyclic lactone autoinducer peptide